MALDNWKIPFTGLTWKFTSGDKAAARAVISQLEDKRLLFGVRMFEDERYCVESAILSRRDLTRVLEQHPVTKEMEHMIKAIRSAMRRFVDQAGPDAVNFSSKNQYGPDAFSVALGELRSSVGFHVGVISNLFNLSVSDELAAIVPPSYEDDDGSYAPGYELPI